jgi:hypothetical protein
MAISPQSIRKGTIIKFDGKKVDKQTIISASESWNENHQNLFKKLLQQGGSFYINDILVSVTPEEKTFNSRGESDGGIQKVDPLARF